VRAKAWDKDQEDRLLKECSEAINQAVDDYLAVPAQATEAMFNHLYAILPDSMREQRSTALRFAPTIGELHG
jgi:pyruvate dehydrogenase E1 component alpha subunit